jgi:inosine-uridine nucleoside N-ribohydrolase
LAGRPRLIVDCDPGHDDAVALVVADYYGDLVAITTVGGNAPLIDVTNNALLTCQLFGIDAPVHAGSTRPLVAEPRHAPEVHGVRGFDGPTLPPLQRSVASHDAVEFLIETIRAEEGLWLIPTGPLTNVALVFREAPDVAGRLAGVSFMGGSATVGNHTPVAEFNALVDPEAMSVVLESGARIIMSGLDLTYQFPVDDTLAMHLRAVAQPRRDGPVVNPGALLLADLVANYLDQLEGLTGLRQGGLHDPCAVLAVTHPGVISTSMRHVQVELAGTLTRGMTVVDQRKGEPTANRGRPNVAHAHTLDHRRALSLVIDAIKAKGAVSDQHERSGV